MKPDDRTRVLHMIEAAEEAMGFVRGLPPESIHRDRMLALACVRCLEVVGEAAAGLTGEFLAEHLEIPLRDVVAMRNRLIHGYFDIDLERVWDTLTDDLPALVDALRPISGR